MAAGADVMGSAADMLGAVDFGDSLGSGDTGDADLGAPSGIDAGSDDLTTDDGIMPEGGEGETIDEPLPEDPASLDQAAAPAPEAQPAQSELPEGVREATINGKKEMRLTPARYETFHTAHKTLREFEQAIGEPVTSEAFDVRNRAYNGQERLYSDLLSGEPEAQGRVLSHFIDEAARAVQEGEVGTDPTITLGQALYDTLQQKSPDAYAHLRMRAAGDLINEMYSEAQRSGDKNLAISASHIAKSLGLSYKKDADITQFLATPPASADPVATLRAENQRLQDQIKGGQTAAATEQWQSWKGQTTKAVTSGVLNDAVLPSLSAERKAWEKFPTQFDNLVIAPLNKAVKQTIVQDKGFAERIVRLEQSAQRAASAQKRAEIAGQIRQAYINRARLAVDVHKSSVLREAAVLLKQGNDATHQRHTAAQGQRGPRGPQNPAPQSLIPGQDVVNPGGIFDAKAEARRLSQLMR